MELALVGLKVFKNQRSRTAVRNLFLDLKAGGILYGHW